MHGIEPNPGPPESKLTIAHVNINGITAENKVDELEQFITTNNIQILALTETKIDKTVAECQYLIHNFHPPLSRHRTRHGGGVALYVHKSLPVQRLSNIEVGDEEWVWAKIKTHSFTLLISCIYLPPSLSVDRLQTFLDNFTEANCRAQTHTPTAIISLGDFNAGNIYLDHGGAQHSGITPFDRQLKDTAHVLDLSQVIDQPTRLTQNMSNLRDLIFTSNSDMIQQSGVLSSFGNLDHFPVFAVLKLTPPTLDNDEPLVTIWDYQNMDTNLLTNLLLNTDWTSIINKDIDTATIEFIATLNHAASTAIPKIQLKKKHNCKSWITADLKRQIRKRDRMFKLAKEKQTDSTWARWRYQRNVVTSMNRRLKDEHIHGQIEKLLAQKHDPYKYHKTLKTITGRARDDTIPPLLGPNGDVVTDDLGKATILVDHFATQSTLHVPATFAPPPANVNEPLVPTLERVTTSEQEVLRILNSLDINKSTGPDGLSAKFIKLTAILIAKPLSQLFNKSLSHGIYPNKFKEANVKPIFKKKGSPSDPTCYRPISILSVLSKAFERIVHHHIYDHISDHALLSDKQSGYRRNHSTELQLHYLTHNLYTALDAGKDFTAVYLDISKYFDKIWHKGLLQKCKNEFGITGSLLKWLKSYLSDRTQRVQSGNSFSDSRKINAGCPQGSVLGPLLALLYLNDLSHRTHNDILLFADDTSLYAPHTATNLLTTQQTLQDDLDAIYNYGQEWAITFNAAKTAQQTFSHKKQNNTPKLTFGGIQIPINETHKHLGMTFSKDLRFHAHVNEALNKVNKAISPLYAIARHLPRHTLDQLYKVYIRPHLDYCDTIYDGHITMRDSTRLETFQNRAARLTTGTLFRTSSDKLRHELGWDKLTTRRKMHRLTLYHKITISGRHNIPDYITTIIPATRAHETNRTLRNANHHTQAQIRTTLHQRSFFCLTGNEWNALPEDIKQLSYQDFKKCIIQQLGTSKPPTYYSHGTKTVNTLHTRLRTDMSHLNAHMFIVQKSDSPACACGYPQENTSHFILSCPKHIHCRNILFNSLSQTLNCNFQQKTKPTQLQILLHGTNLSDGDGRAVARHFQKYLTNSSRFASVQQN